MLWGFLFKNSVFQRWRMRKRQRGRQSDRYGFWLNILALWFIDFTNSGWVGVLEVTVGVCTHSSTRPLSSSILFRSGISSETFPSIFFGCFYIDLWALFGRAQEELCSVSFETRGSLCSTWIRVKPISFFKLFELPHEVSLADIYTEE